MQEDAQPFQRTAQETPCPPTAKNDWELYGEFSAGDAAAFRELFGRYQSRIFNLSYRIVRDRAAAEDVAQDVLIRIYEKKARFRANVKFSTWVYRVAVNASLDHVRKKRFFGFSLDETPLDVEGDAASSSREVLEKEELQNLVSRAVQALPEKLRLPILLFQFEEKSYQEIADILEISAKAVERRIYQAKVLLRKALVSGGV